MSAGCDDENRKKIKKTSTARIFRLCVVCTHTASRLTNRNRKLNNKIRHFYYLRHLINLSSALITDRRPQIFIHFFFSNKLLAQGCSRQSQEPCIIIIQSFSFVIHSCQSTQSFMSKIENIKFNFIATDLLCNQNGAVNLPDRFLTYVNKYYIYLFTHLRP